MYKIYVHRLTHTQQQQQKKKNEKSRNFRLAFHIPQKCCITIENLIFHRTFMHSSKEWLNVDECAGQIEMVMLVVAGDVTYY